MTSNIAQTTPYKPEKKDLVRGQLIFQHTVFQRCFDKRLHRWCNIHFPVPPHFLPQKSFRSVHHFN